MDFLMNNGWWLIPLPIMALLARQQLAIWLGRR
jgi:hypothetical protein